VCLRLHDDPAALAAVLQVMVVAMWVYAAFQKAYQREYLDGTYFYFTVRDGYGWRLGKWASYIRQVPRVDGDFGPVDPAVRTFFRWMAVVVLLGETVPPVLGFAMNGTVWGVLLLLAVILPVGLSSMETNFMITNLLVATTFLVPFQASAFRGAFGDPVIAGVLGFYLAWPPVHAVLARHLRVSPWKLAGWGMYSAQKPHVQIVVPGGELTPLRGSIPARVLMEFGACRIAWVRDAIRRYFVRWDHPEPATGLVFRWKRIEGDRYVTRCVVARNVPGTPAQAFEIADEASAAAFTRYVRSLSLEPAPLAQGTVAVAAV
jgi:hypothetical protein